jgi:uncharacterized protein
MAAMSSDRTEEIAAAMAEPGFYPDRPPRVEVRETHISWVFLAGELAFKLRKPVVFPFLDYGTPERRRHMGEEEVRLGRRLAPSLYLGLRAVLPRESGFALADADRDDALEHVVVMRRFEEASTLAARLEAGSATEADVRAVARRIARFHSAAEPAPAGSFGPPQVAATVSENFTTLLAFADEIGDPRLAAAHRFAVAFLHGRHAQLAARVTSGHVRDCHGDLRAEHVIGRLRSVGDWQDHPGDDQARPRRRHSGDGSRPRTAGPAAARRGRRSSGRFAPWSGLERTVSVAAPNRQGLEPPEPVTSSSRP